MVQGNRFAWQRNGDFQNAHKFIFEDYFVGVGCCLNGVVAFWEIGFLLSEDIRKSGRNKQRTGDRQSEEKLLAAARQYFSQVHAK